MKKVFALVILVLVASLLVMPVFAASAHMSVSASKGTVSRGDTVTVTVSTGAVENCFSGGFMFSYNKDVFEYVSGSKLVSGFAMAGVSTAGGNVSGYFMNTDSGTTVSGSLFQITLKVKDNAPYGSYTISGTPSMTILNGDVKENVSCSAGAATVTVACNHSYGAVTKLDDNQHGKTCSNCGDVQKEDHKWGGDKVIKEATCKEGGQIQQTCSVCSATHTISTDPTTNHKYGSWTKLDDTQHKHTCSVCQKEETAGHNWDNGKVTKEATCKEEGEKTYTCSDCKATKKEHIPKPDVHKYGSWIKVNDDVHKHTCSVCQKEETAGHNWDNDKVTKEPTCKEEGVKTYTCSDCKGTKTEVLEKLTTHTYDHDCDTDCNVCGLTRETTHQYKTTWSKDKNEHWHECAVCKDKIDVEAHVADETAGPNDAVLCTVCSYVMKPKPGHKHSYANTWTTDEKGHWYVCSGCEEKGSYADHDFENACDTDCSVCGYTRQIQHTFDEKWATDENNHWHECTSCGLKQDEAAHEPGAEATATTAQTCTICDYEIAPALGVEETTEPTEVVETTVPQTPAEPDDSTTAKFPWWIVIAIAVAVIGAVVGFASVATKKKKK